MDEEKPQDQSPTPPAKESATPTQPSSAKSKLPLIILVLLLILIIPLGGYAVFNLMNQHSTPAPLAKSGTGETACTQDAKICPDGTSVGRQGPNCDFAPCPTETPSSAMKTYTDTDGGWQIDYPEDAGLKIESLPATQIGEAGVGEVRVFSKLGPTQTEGTEFHDGISVTIGVMAKDAGKSLKEFADEQTQVDTEIGSKTPLKPISQNALDGFETTMSSLGTFRIIFLDNPTGENRVYYISIFSDGPGESNAQYDAIVEEMLRTFRYTSDKPKSLTPDS